MSINLQNHNSIENWKFIMIAGKLQCKLEHGRSRYILGIEK